ncbi:hypothetical protein NUM3379_37260 [Kineococcus sp. NUM-3379]
MTEPPRPPEPGSEPGSGHRPEHRPGAGPGLERPAGQGAAAEPAPGPAGAPVDGAGVPAGRPVRLRRAPRYGAFVLTGLLAALVVSALVAALATPSGGYSRLALFGYLAVALGLVGAVLGGLVAVLLERRR